MTRHNSYSLIEKFVCLTFFIVVVAADQECDVTKCRGPLRYYKDLGCTPVYENPGDCCAVKYNCDHLQNRAKNKCHVNNHEYDIGEKLREEDANPCDIGCFCGNTTGEIAEFICAVVDCFHGAYEPGCYSRRSPTKCCPGEQICPKDPSERAKCEVDGKTYLDGEYFKPKDADDDVTCYCQPGYQGENVEPFCAKPNRPYCDPQFRNVRNIYEKCAPVYYAEQPPQTSCSVAYRCQNSNDTIVVSPGSKTLPEEHGVCEFGNIKMKIGEELNRDTDYSSRCVKCLCEVPPYPTCQRLPNEACE